MKKSLFLLALFLFSPMLAAARTGIVAVVNDDVISELDFERRLAFTQAVGGPDVQKKETRERVLRLMIDERLKRQDAADHGVSVGEEELRRAVDVTMRQNGTTEKEMTERLKKKGVPFSVLKDQIESDLLFVKTIRKIAGERSEISEAEVKSKLEEIENQIREKQYLLSEIVLPVENEEDDGAVYGQAVKIVMKLKEGASFEELAKQYSKSASAARGGLLGWVAESSLNDAVKEEISLMDKGQVSTPVRTKDGYALYALRAVRSPEDLKERDAYHIAQILIPPSSPEKRRKLLQNVSLTKGSCLKFVSLAQSEKKTPRSDLGTVPVSELPRPILELLEKTPLLEPTEPLKIDGGELVFMACSKEKMSVLPSEDRLRDQIETKRLEMTAERRLRELRRTAITEIRI